MVSEWVHSTIFHIPYHNFCVYVSFIYALISIILLMFPFSQRSIHISIEYPICMRKYSKYATHSQKQEIFRKNKKQRVQNKTHNTKQSKNCVIWCSINTDIEPGTFYTYSLKISNFFSFKMWTHFDSWVTVCIKHNNCFDLRMDGDIILLADRYLKDTKKIVANLLINPLICVTNVLINLLNLKWEHTQKNRTLTKLMPNAKYVNACTFQYISRNLNRDLIKGTTTCCSYLFSWIKIKKINIFVASKSSYYSCHRDCRHSGIQLLLLFRFDIKASGKNITIKTKS